MFFWMDGGHTKTDIFCRARFSHSKWFTSYTLNCAANWAVNRKQPLTLNACRRETCKIRLGHRCKNEIWKINFERRCKRERKSSECTCSTRVLIVLSIWAMTNLPRSQGAHWLSPSRADLRIESGRGSEWRTMAPYKPYSAIIVLFPQHFSVLRHLARRFWNQTCEWRRVKWRI